MALAIIAIAYDSTQASADVENRITRPAADAAMGVELLGNELHTIAGGLRRGNVTMLVETGSITKPSATCTLGGAALTADDTIVIGPVTLTWKAAAANENEITIGGDDAESAAALAAAINAHTDLGGMVTAESDGVDVVTITGALPGNLCRYGISRTETNATAMVLSAAVLGGVTSAVESTPRSYSRGL
jgi:hypothetical protein